MIIASLLFVILILAICLCGCLYLWYRDHHLLIDKLMSRSYPEYVQAQVYEKSKPAESLVLPTGDEADDSSVLSELNSMLGTR